MYNLGYNYCYYCRRKFGQQCGHVTKDHVLPLSRGGKNILENIVNCCEECNVNKGDMLLWEWETRLTSKYGARMQPNPEWRARVDTILTNIRKHHLYEPPFDSKNYY